MAERVALNLRWCFGFNKDSNDGTLIDLTGEGRQAIFYAVGHTGIIFDYEVRRQRLLQGHTNTIMCAAASDDKKWLVTADAGDKDTMVVVWNSRTAVPVRTIFDAHPGGVLCCDITHDAVYVATVGAGPNQSLSIWEWTVSSDAPLHTEAITSKDLQHCVRFSRDDPKELVTNGPARTIFWNWSEEKLRYYSPAISSKEFLTPVGRFTKSVFLPNSTQAVTGKPAAHAHMRNHMHMPAHTHTRTRAHGRSRGGAKARTRAAAAPAARDGGRGRAAVGPGAAAGTARQVRACENARRIRIMDTTD